MLSLALQELQQEYAGILDQILVITKKVGDKEEVTASMVLIYIRLVLSEGETINQPGRIYGRNIG